MLLVALSWSYIFVTSISLGAFFQKLFRIKTSDISITAILGLFAVTILSSSWAFFGRINWEFHIMLVLLNTVLLLRFRREISLLLKDTFEALWALPNGLKTAMALISLLILAQCAAPPYIVDNESYYIQTVKWLNEHGFVKGLANLHFFFGQTSGWHVAQSVFSFPFVHSNFNDLSGFCLLIGNLFAFRKLNEFRITRKYECLIIGMFPLANLFFFRFIGAPAPDIAVYVLSFMIFYLFIDNYNTKNVDGLKLLLLLIVFAIYIKATAITLLALPIILMFQSRTIRIDYRVLTVSAVVFILFICKNLMLSGYPLFPFPIRLTGWSPLHQVPEILMHYFSQNKSAAFYLSEAQYAGMSAGDIVLKWLSVGGLDGMFNKLAIALVVLAPAVVAKYFNKREYWLMYAAMVLQLGVLFVFSPQYRFFLNFMLLFLFICLAPLFRHKQVLHSILYLSILPCAILLLFPLNLSGLTDNALAKETQTLTKEMIIVPSGNSKTVTHFDYLQNGNLRYFSPHTTSFLWQTGDGPLPCVNKEQLQFIARYFHVTPQLISNNIEDGFYSKKND